MNIPDCGPEVAKRYKALSTDPHIKEEVANMCSEYGENIPICSQPKRFLWLLVYSSNNNSLILFIHYSYDQILCSDL
jgi:hypothetical protein